jgi:hypothetical protein
VGGIRTFAGFDPAFTAGGDANALQFATVGRTIKGKMQCLFDNETIEIRPAVTNSEEYNKAVAKRVVKMAKDRGMRPGDFAMDGSNDGGMMARAIEEEWGESGIQLLSSLMAATSAKYATRVTQYWMSVRDVLKTGCVKGFNVHSKYARDLFERRFAEEQKVFKLEKKRDMKKRIRRSPDAGDSFAYCSHVINESGLLSVESLEERLRATGGTKVHFYYRRGQKESEPEEDEFSDSLFDEE